MTRKPNRSAEVVAAIWSSIELTLCCVSALTSSTGRTWRQRHRLHSQSIDRSFSGSQPCTWCQDELNCDRAFVFSMSLVANLILVASSAKNAFSSRSNSGRSLSSWSSVIGFPS